MLAKNKKNKNKHLIKEIIFSVFLAALFIGLISFAIISNLRVGNKRDQYLRQIEELQKQIKDAEERRKELEKSVSSAGSQEYLEEVARKNFNLKSPGEEVVVIAKEKEEQGEVEEKIEAVESENEKNMWDPKTWWEWISGKK